ncbi:translation elongation factor Ts [Candidatus Dependentiae bacterium]|nr:translation elongation factor Ts [Candidatus Dependentiae bacterium]
MAKITMELVKELREKTQVGMMDCKKALILAEGDIEKAIEILRKKGASVAAKRAEHATNNGTVAAYITPDHKTGALLEIGCETDFSANTSDMKTFANTVCEHLAKTSLCSNKWCEPACLIEQKLGDKLVKTMLNELVAKIAENIKISQCARFSPEANGFVNAYIHPGATLGTMIELEVKGLDDANKEILVQLSRDICMQIAVSNPLTIDPSQVNQETIEKEKCIIAEQLKSTGKPEQMIDKIMVGKMNKFYEEVCLIKQKYIKQDKLSVEQHMNDVAKKAGCTITIKQFKRFAIGK